MIDEFVCNECGNAIYCQKCQVVDWTNWVDIPVFAGIVISTVVAIFKCVFISDISFSHPLWRLYIAFMSLGVGASFFLRLLKIRV